MERASEVDPESTKVKEIGYLLKSEDILGWIDIWIHGADSYTNCKLLLVD